jgi:hypothetical protein
MLETMGPSSARLGLVLGLVVALAVSAAAGCQIIAGLDDPVPGVPKAEGGVGVDAPTRKDVVVKSDTSMSMVDTGTGDSGSGGGDTGSDTGSDTGESAGDSGIAFVQGNSIDFMTVDAGTLTIGTTNAGDLVVVNLSYDVASAPVVSDTLGDNYRVAIGPVTDFQEFTHYVEYAEDVPSGELSISVTLGATPSSSFEVYVLEYSGVIPSGSLDVVSVGTGTSMAVDGMKSGFKTTTVPNELIFGYGETYSASPGTGFTLRENLNSNVAEDKFVTKIGSYETTATMTGGPSWIMLMATFKGF